MFFEGLSPLSKLIKFFTRSTFSHVAVFDKEKGCLIEAWGNIKHGVYWQYSSLKKHTEGTPYEIYSIEVNKKQYKEAMRFYRFLADRCFPYNYIGVIGFVLPFFTSNGGFFCSEGCYEGLAFSGFAPKEVPGWKFSPDGFYNFLLSKNAKLIERGEV